jgi:hypothetical protein
MTQQVVYLNEARVHSFTGGPEEVVMLRPGRNLIPEAVLLAVRDKSDTMRDMIEAGTVIMEGNRVDVTKMDVKRAVNTIEMETTIAGVQDLLDQEIATKKPRKMVVDSAKAKIIAIQEADAKEAEAAAKVAKKGEDVSAN